MIAIERGELERLGEAAGLSDDQLRFDYSGRGMYGDRCFGIVGGPSDLLRFVQACAEEDCALDIVAALPDVRSDSMGRDYIYYWPLISVAPEAPEAPMGRKFVEDESGRGYYGG